MNTADDQIDQLLATIQDALDASGLYVAPSMAKYVDAADVAQIESALARSPEPLFVVVHPFSYGDAFNGNPGDLLSRLHDRSGNPGLYVGNDQVRTDGDVRLEARAWGDQAGGYSTTYAVTEVGEAAGPDDLGAQLVAVTEAVADGTLTEQFLALAEEGYQSSTGDSGSSGAGDGDGGPGVATNIVGGVLVAIAIWVAVRRLVRRRGSGPGSTRDYTLPASVLERVRDAHDEQLTRRAHREVLALGEHLDAADLDPAAAPDAWQAALDHYDAARRVLGEGDTEVDVLDVVGAIVLARRGDEALAAARAGRRFEPTTPCFLDPLHDGASAEGTIEVSGRRIAVPLCGDCRSELRRKRRPDILDVVRDGRPVHYFETDHEPWASTGYGALSPDLIERLHRRR